MSLLTVTVNGAAVAADIEPRLHLADFLRNHLLLTGTHLGCEHGVCGACTLLIDGEPARSCITFAAACGERDVRSIEGLNDDPIVAALRIAFSAEHALQCGYCSPGMLVTARDIVLRLPGANADQIRVELAGNLCRCTGYNGIVRAIQSVLLNPPLVVTTASEQARANASAVVPPLPSMPAEAVRHPFARAGVPSGHGAQESASPENISPGNTTLEQRMILAVSRETVWAALQDPALVAACIPGAAITAIDGHRITGTLATGLGPIRARFTGTGTIVYDSADTAGVLTGEGSDATTRTRLRARATFRVEAVDGGSSQVILGITYGLRGALAQFARGPLVRAIAEEIAVQVTRNLEVRLRGSASPPAAQTGIAMLLIQALRRRLRKLLRPQRR